MTRGAQWRTGIAALFLVVAGIAVWKLSRLRPLFWARIMSGKAELNGRAVPSAYLYRGSCGCVMIYLHPQDLANDELYVVRLRQAEVGVVPPNYPYFWFVTRYGAFSKEYADPSINMLHPKNNYTDPYLQLAEDSATFKNLEGETIHIQW